MCTQHFYLIITQALNYNLGQPQEDKVFDFNYYNMMLCLLDVHKGCNVLRFY